MTQLVTVLLGGVGIGSVFALVALGFSFVFRTTASFNFAQGSLVTLGSLLTYTVFTHLGAPAVVALVVAVLGAAAVGGLLERVGIYPLGRRDDNDPLLWIMTTLGLAAIATGVALRVWGSNPLGVENYVGSRVTHFGGAYIATPYLLAIGGSVLVAGALGVVQTRTRWGRIMSAIADNRSAVQLAGVNTLTYGLAAYAVGGAIAGVAGFLIAPITFASAAGGFTFTIMGFAALAMGGFTSLWGAVVGGWLVGVIQSLSGTYLGLQYANFSVFFVLLVVLMIKPSGIFGSARTREV